MIVAVDGLDPERLADVDRPDDLHRYAQPHTSHGPAASQPAAPSEDPRERSRDRRRGAGRAARRRRHRSSTSASPTSTTRPTSPAPSLIPLGEVPERVDEIPADGPVYVICRTGARSMRAAEFLVAQGFDATNVAGGTMAWIDAGARSSRAERRVDRSVSHELVDTDAGVRRGHRRAARPSRPTRSTPSSTASARTSRKLALVQVAWRDGLALDRSARGRHRARSPRCSTGPGVAVLHAADQDLEVLELACGTGPEHAVRHPDRGRLRRHVDAVAGQPRTSEILGIRVPKGDRLTDWLRPPAQRRPADLRRRRRRPPARGPRPAGRRPRGARPARVGQDECEDARIRDRGARDPERGLAPHQGDPPAARAGPPASPSRWPAWRERRAAEVDQPVRFVLPDLALVGIAQRPPTSTADLRKIRGLDDRHLRGNQADAVIAAVHGGPGPPVGPGARSRRRASSTASCARPSRWCRPGSASWAATSRSTPRCSATRADIEALLRERRRRPAGRRLAGRAGRRADPPARRRRGGAGLRRPRRPGARGPLPPAPA